MKLRPVLLGFAICAGCESTQMNPVPSVQDRATHLATALNRAGFVASIHAGIDAGGNVTFDAPELCVPPGPIPTPRETALVWEKAAVLWTNRLEDVSRDHEVGLASLVDKCKPTNANAKELAKSLATRLASTPLVPSFDKTNVILSDPDLCFPPGPRPPIGETEALWTQVTEQWAQQLSDPHAPNMVLASLNAKC